MSIRPATSRHAPVPPWRDVRVLGWLAQIAALLAVLLVAGYLAGNLLTAMDKRGLFPDFGFLRTSAGFEIGEKIVDYRPTDTYAQALIVGLVNTLVVSIAGVVLATILGLGVGLARLSRNWLVNRLALAYVELFRNTPLLVQLFIIYFAVFLTLPPVRESIALPGSMFVNQRGVFLPRPLPGSSLDEWLVFVGAGALIATVAFIVAARREAAGRPLRRPRTLGSLAFLGMLVAGWFLVAEPPLSIEIPEPGRFNFSGGLALSPELSALLLGLTLYTAAFIAEVIRGGIQSVSKGQLEAARALGLREGAMLRLVVLPQALRVIIPPLTSQYLNLVKNSSLATAIGFADLFNVSTTVSNQTGQPIAVITLVMGIYLCISLLTSLLMNLYNRRVQIPAR